MLDDAATDVPKVEEELAELETAVDALVGSFGAMRERAAAAEENHRKLAEALRETDLETIAPTELQARLEDLAEENSRLRIIVDEARTRAQLVRRRLMLMEDELDDE